MENNQNWENITEEAKTTPKSEHPDASATADAEEVQTPVTEIVEEATADDQPDSKGVAPDGEPEDADWEEAEDTPTVVPAPMRKREKIILTVVGIILVLLLIWLLISLVNGIQRSNTLRPVDDLAIVQTDSTAPAGSVLPDGGDDDIAVSTDPVENDSTVATQPGEDGSQGSGADNGTTPSNPGNGNGAEPTQPNQDNTTKPTQPGTDVPAEPSKPGSSEGGDDGRTDGGDKNEGTGDDTASDYTGEVKIRISGVNDDTGIITITIEGESIMVPVQTTVFNGRVTKSGVAQSKIFGYNTGVTVMLYYQQTAGFGVSEITGYMNRTEDSLTILVDLNGDGSKLLIKVNGLKSLM